MHRAVSFLPLALLFLASAVPSNGQSVESTTAAVTEAAEPQPEFIGEVHFYDVRGALELNCSSLGGKVAWKVNNTELDKRTDLKEHITTDTVEGLLKVNGRSTELDFGNYSCSNGAAVLGFMVKANLHAKLPANTNVVEGQKLKLACKVIGRPCVGVVWSYTNESAEANATDVKTVFGDRVKLAPNGAGITDGELTIESAERSDAGWFKCTPLSDDSRANITLSVTQLRVKDMYAALWPFLGICAEVFVLCAVILVYEKRRTKPELDDSDTDNHDQKKS